jgi:hypothetical protein
MPPICAARKASGEPNCSCPCNYLGRKYIRDARLGSIEARLYRVDPHANHFDAATSDEAGGEGSSLALGMTGSLA